MYSFLFGWVFLDFRHQSDNFYYLNQLRRRKITRAKRETFKV